MKSQCTHSEIGGWDCRLAWKLVDQLAHSTQCNEEDKGEPDSRKWKTRTDSRKTFTLASEHTNAHVCIYTQTPTRTHTHPHRHECVYTHTCMTPQTMSKISKMTFIT